MTNRIADRYEEVRPLGEGALSRITLVRDTVSGELRALKRLQARDEATAGLMRNEYAALARIRHENVVRVHEFGVLPGGETYFTMDFIDGRPIDEAIRPGDVTRTLAASLQAWRGLAALHAGGVVHCDIKPDNLLVSNDGEPAGARAGEETGAPHGPLHLRIVDLGFAGRLTDAAGEKVRGTPGYVAPEVLDGAPYSRESDLYALGATLYRVLSGRPAFPGRDAAAVLAAQRRGLPSVLALRAAGVPTALDRPLLGLLSPDPRHRAAAAREWMEIAEKRGEGRTRESQAQILLSATPFVGRSSLLADARAALEPMGPARAMILVGPPGSGRTRLAREIAIEAELAGRAVLWFDPGRTPSEESISRQTERALMVLDDVDLWTESAVTTLSVPAAFARGLTIVATQVRPPEAGDSVYRILLSAKEPPAPDVRPVEPLSPDEVDALVAGILQADPPAGLGSQLIAAAGALPGALLSELALWCRRGRLRGDGGRWWLDETIESEPLHPGGQLPGEREWLGLDPEARCAAVARAAWPLPASISELAGIAGLEPAALARGFDQLSWLGHLAAREEAESIIPASLADYARLRARETSLVPIRTRLRERLHRATIEAAPGLAPAIRLAAGMQEIALGDTKGAWRTLRSAFREAVAGPELGPIASRAIKLLVELPGPDDLHESKLFAEMARFEADQNHGLTADSLWSRAIASLPTSETERRFGWTIERAENLQAINRFADAHALLDGATESSQSQGFPALLRGRALSARGWCRQRMGRSAEAFADFEAARTVLPPEADEDRATLLNRLGFAIARAGDPARGYELLEEALRLANRSGNPRVGARVHGNRGALAAERGDFKAADPETLAAMKLMTGAGSVQWQFVGATNLVANASARCDWPAWDRAYAMLESVGRTSGNPLAYTRACQVMANRCLRQGRVAEAARSIRLGAPWAHNSGSKEYEARHEELAAMVESLRGAPNRSRRLLRRAYRRARAAGMDLVAYFALSPLAELELVENRLDAALNVARRAWQSRFVSPSDNLAAGLAIAHVLARRGDADELNRHIEGALPVLSRHAEAGVLDANAAQKELLALRAALTDDISLEDLHWTEARRVLDELDLTPRIVLTEWTLARIDIARNRTERALPRLREALERALRSGLDTWATRIAQDAFPALAAGPPSVTSPQAEGRGELLLEIIAMVNSMLDFSTLVGDALSMVSRRVRADRGFILLTQSDSDELVEVAHFGTVDDEARSSARDVSRTIVHWVAERGEVYRRDGAGGDPRLGSTQSVLDLSIRSLVCVPLRQRDRVIGTIYLESRAEGAYFTESDVSLVESFAHLVAVAIENSRLHEELKRSRDRVISENLSLRRDASRRFSDANIIGQSLEMERVLGEVARVAATGVNVLITGETGTGKELIARSIHYASPRAGAPLISVNCNALNEGILEAELFGTEKGAATGVVARPGIFERADGGTLFLDEVGDMPLRLQARLLRVLQEREFTRVGGSRVHKVDVRVISATFRDLPERIRQGEFREDLYHRLHQVQIEIPPLRERKVDIPILAEHFLQQFCEKHARPIPKLSEGFLSTIMNEKWSGNVRELENYVLRCVVMTDGPVLEPVVPPPSQERKRRRPASQVADWLGTDGDEQPAAGLEAALEEIERRWIRKTLEETKGNQRRAAELLGVKEPTLRYRLRRLGLAAGSRARGATGTRGKRGH